MRNPLLFLVLAVFVLAGISGYYWNRTRTLENKPPIVIEKELTPPVPEEGYATGDWKTWMDSFYDKTSKIYETYSVKYPRDFDLLTGSSATGGFLDNPKAEITFPKDSFQKPASNFSQAYITLSTDASRSTDEKCYSWPENLESLSITRDVGGLTFRSAAGSEAGAGNLYSSKAYRTLFNKRCYELALTVHTGAIGNYPEGTVSFDEERAFSVLDQIFSSFKVATSTEVKLR